MILTPLEAIVGIAFNAVSRRFEYQADRFACELQDRLKNEEMSDLGDRLGRALVQLHVKNLSTVWVDWLCVFSSSSHVDRAGADVDACESDTLPTTTHIRR